MGPCEGHETIENYQKQVDAIREILKGNFKESMKDFKRVTDLALNMHFEEAQKIKEKIEILENYQSRSTIVNPKITNIDVFNSFRKCSLCQLSNFPRFHHSIHTMEIKKKLDETDEELLLAIIELRERFQLLSREVIVPFHVDLGENIKNHGSSIGRQKSKF
jgi:excinuclease ABC subunit C